MVCMLFADHINEIARMVNRSFLRILAPLCTILKYSTMKLELTKEQIEQLTKNEIEKLNVIYAARKEKLELKLKADLAKLDESMKADIEKLKGKFKFIEYSGKVGKVAVPERKTRVRLDPGKIKELVDQKKSVKEIAAELNTTEASIRAKLGRMKIKLTD